jgi:UDP-glucose 4-epimerase
MRWSGGRAAPDLLLDPAIFGEPRYLPIDEDHPRPDQPLRRPMHGERALRDFDAAHGLRSVRLRYSMPPARPSAAWVNGDPNALAAAAAAASGGAGMCRSTGAININDTCIRDFVTFRPVRSRPRWSISGRRSGTAFNLGNGSGFSVPRRFAPCGK